MKMTPRARILNTSATIEATQRMLKSLRRTPSSRTRRARPPESIRSRRM
jgi:hypothetical protein